MLGGRRSELRGHAPLSWADAMEQAVRSDMLNLSRNVPVITDSKGLQKVNITLPILFRLVASQLPRIYTSISEDYDEQVSDDLTERAATFGVILDDVSLTHLTSGKEFSEAVEAKQVAQQEAERARSVVEKAEQQKKSAIISAEGDSKAAKLIDNFLAMAGNGLIELWKLKVAEDIAYQLTPSGNTYLPAGQLVLLQLPQ
ncbi:Prohibitin [Microtus ochrogaster]|uniref:Prohibitin n=1 Tax=Microtus ochrogaster TaxID=79684 RepID=A0A8J6KVG3_MICOH|nr:Prohibitin [Microtus ochrogaster]